MSRRSPLPALLLGALLLTGCAVGEDPASTGGTGLEPNLVPVEKKDKKASRSGKPGRKERPARGNDAPTGSVTPTTESPASGPDDGAKSAEPESPASPAPAPIDGALRASQADARGDVTGMSPPAFADLTGATLVREGDRMSLAVDAAAAYPAASGDRTMNVILFVDTDGDGQVDYEIWGTLADNGWSGTWRHPDGAKFGSDSGVTVDPARSTLGFAFPAGHLGGADSFRWTVGAEYGSFEQQATGTMTSDFAPDSGAAAFPAKR